MYNFLVLAVTALMGLINRRVSNCLKIFVRTDCWRFVWTRTSTVHIPLLPLPSITWYTILDCASRPCNLVASSELSNEKYTSDSPELGLAPLAIVRREARVNSLIIGTNCGYFVVKCDRSSELAMPRVLY